MRWETKGPFLVSTEILGFLSIFKKSQTSSPFEALNSMCLSRYQSDVTPPIQMRWSTMVFSRVSTQDSDIPHLGDATRACIQATSGKSDLISSQGISVSTQLEVAKSGSLSQTYCSGKATLEVLMESWPTCSIESWESALFSRRYRLNRAFLEFLC